jgi:hypothetical protein
VKRRPTAATRLRGVSAGLLTATLVVAAHAVAGGALSGAGIALIAVLAASVGAVAASTEGTTDVWPLLTLLTVGQLLGHLVLSVVGHTHSAVSAPPAAAMLAAHAAALMVGAALIAAADRLSRAVSTAMGGCVRTPSRPPATAAAAPVVAGDQPMRSAQLLAASVSHRGPPVSLAR